MNSAYPPGDMPQHMGIQPHTAYQQPPLPPAIPPAAGIDPYQQQHQHHPPPQNHQPPPHPHMPLHPHAHQQHHTPHQQPPPDDSELPRHIPAEEQPQGHQPPAVIARVEEGSNRRYHLDVVQQPERARMCGYGDKDRRPITPPPCVRLVITDATTGEEINCKDIDYTMFVLNVDLWDERGGSEVNLCRQPTSTGAPAVSTAPGYSYAPVNGGDSTSMRYAPQAMPPSRDMTYAQPPPPMGYVQDYQVPQAYAQATPAYPPNGTYGPPQQFFPPHQGYRPDPTVATLPSQRYDPSVGYIEGAGPSVAYVHDQYKGALNRNLIGSVAASAFCLTDTTGREGIWFVLQDLSVRLEGKYKLRFSFVNVGYPGAGSRDKPSAAINRGRTPILASCFSNSFQVYSAKKFPGVWESTALSKTFATQGIKIPIRKDGGKGGDDDDGD